MGESVSTFLLYVEGNRRKPTPPCVFCGHLGVDAKDLSPLVNSWKRRIYIPAAVNQWCDYIHRKTFTYLLLFFFPIFSFSLFFVFVFLDLFLRLCLDGAELLQLS